MKHDSMACRDIFMPVLPPIQASLMSLVSGFSSSEALGGHLSLAIPLSIELGYRVF